MRNLGRFQGWRRWGESSLQDAPESGPLRPNQSLAVLSDGEYREGSWSCQQRRQRLVVGRQLEKVLGSSREELICRVGKNMKEDRVGFLAFLLPRTLQKAEGIT